jgi:hypothetical protein
MEKESQNLSQDNTTSDGSTVTPPSGTNPPAGGAADAEDMIAELAKELAAVNKTLAPWDLAMSDSELRAMFYISRGREPYVDAGKVHIDAHGSDYLPGKALSSFHTAYALKHGLEPLARQIDQFCQRIRVIQVAAGNTCYQHTSDFEKQTAIAGKRGDTVAREIAADLASKRPPAGRKPTPDEASTNDAGTQTTPKVDAGAQTMPSTESGV